MDAFNNCRSAGNPAAQEGSGREGPLPTAAKLTKARWLRIAKVLDASAGAHEIFVRPRNTGRDLRSLSRTGPGRSYRRRDPSGLRPQVEQRPAASPDLATPSHRRVDPTRDSDRR